MAVKTVSHAKVMLAATKRLPFKSENATEKMLEFAAGSMAEAYRIGAEEAQSEIIGRLQELPPYPVPSAPKVIDATKAICAGCGFAHPTDYKDCVWLKTRISCRNAVLRADLLESRPGASSDG